MLPAALQPRRADTTAVIGTALQHKADGLGYRRIAALLDRPESTVRRWLRRATPEHTQWIYQRGMQRPVQLAPDTLAELRETGTCCGMLSRCSQQQPTGTATAAGSPTRPGRSSASTPAGQLLAPPG
ncbi:MAG TPA: helix-turn-helix domain-containing protein [Aldersonia sp.]